MTSTGFTFDGGAVANSKVVGAVSKPTRRAVNV
jgi:hypothetical protein